MKHSRLRRLLFLALCCDLGLIAKQIISPAANILTDSLHIPGGIGTGFSLMFITIAAILIDRFGCAAAMGIVQSLIAIAMGRVGSMGALSPLGYIVPCLAIDLVMRLSRRLPMTDRLVAANCAGGICAALTANLIVFRLTGAPLALYLLVAATSGAICGLLGSKVVPLIRRAVQFEKNGGR